MPHISIVTPVYKAEGCLEELYRRLVTAISGITQDFEIIMIEDCGGDRSWEIIQALARKDARVKGLQFSRNFGQHYGITAGLDYCDGDWVVVMDCDLQDRPEENLDSGDSSCRDHHFLCRAVRSKGRHLPQFRVEFRASQVAGRRLRDPFRRNYRPG